MTAAINSTGAGKRGYPTKSSVPETHASTQRRARERSVAIQTLLLVRKSKSSSVKSKTAEEIGRAVQQECRDRTRMPSSARKKKNKNLQLLTLCRIKKLKTKNHNTTNSTKR